MANGNCCLPRLSGRIRNAPSIDLGSRPATPDAGFSEGTRAGRGSAQFRSVQGFCGMSLHWASSRPKTQGVWRHTPGTRRVRGHSGGSCRPPPRPEAMREGIGSNQEMRRGEGSHRPLALRCSQKTVGSKWCSHDRENAFGQRPEAVVGWTGHPVGGRDREPTTGPGLLGEG